MSAILQNFDNVRDGIRRRIATEHYETKAYLDNLLIRIANHRAVEHPFLNYYREHALSKNQERVLFSECYYFFRFLPFYITGIAIKTRDEMILREIVLNVVDEVGQDPTHSSLYRDFLTRIGIDVDDVRKYQPMEATRKLDEGIRILYSESPLIRSLGALYADETMSSIMVSKLNDGLANQGYDKSTRNFWLLHIDVEVGHSNSVFNAISPYIEVQENRERFEKGAFDFLGLVNDFWDGVAELTGQDQK